MLSNVGILVSGFVDGYARVLTAIVLCENMWEASLSVRGSGSPELFLLLLIPASKAVLAEFAIQGIEVMRFGMCS